MPAPSEELACQVKNARDLSERVRAVAQPAGELAVDAGEGFAPVVTLEGGGL